MNVVSSPRLMNRHLVTSGICYTVSNRYLKLSIDSQHPCNLNFPECAPTEPGSESLNLSCGYSLYSLPATALGCHHTVLPALGNRKSANPLSLRPVLSDSAADGRMFNIAAKTKI